MKMSKLFISVNFFFLLLLILGWINSIFEFIDYRDFIFVYACYSLIVIYFACNLAGWYFVRDSLKRTVASLAIPLFLFGSACVWDYLSPARCSIICFSRMQALAFFPGLLVEEGIRYFAHPFAKVYEKNLIAQINTLSHEDLFRLYPTRLVAVDSSDQTSLAVFTESQIREKTYLFRSAVITTDGSFDYDHWSWSERFKPSGKWLGGRDLFPLLNLNNTFYFLHANYPTHNNQTIIEAKNIFSQPVHPSLEENCVPWPNQGFICWEQNKNHDIISSISLIDTSGKREICNNIHLDRESSYQPEPYGHLRQNSFGPAFTIQPSNNNSFSITTDVLMDKEGYRHWYRVFNKLCQMTQEQFPVDTDPNNPEGNIPLSSIIRKGKGRTFMLNPIAFLHDTSQYPKNEKSFLSSVESGVKRAVDLLAFDEPVIIAVIPQPSSGFSILVCDVNTTSRSESYSMKHLSHLRFDELGSHKSTHKLF